MKGKCKMKYDFTPKGVCSRGIHVELDGDVIRSVKFDGGCSGNTQGVAELDQPTVIEEEPFLPDDGLLQPVPADK